MSVLTVENLRLRRGAREVLRGVSFIAGEGEIVALMGLSGGGKTTVLRAITALEPFDDGRIDVAGVVLEGRSADASTLRRLRDAVGMVFQHHSLFEHLTAIENVTLAPVHTGRMSRDEASRRAAELLANLGVAHRSNAFPRELSGGEAQRVAIARAMATDPPLLLMDEPTASLDPARRGELGRTLRSLVASGRTLVVTTHDDDFAREFATRAVILADGVVVEEGDARSVLTSPQHPATRAFLSAEHGG
jgi:polar amino acid transport system ATP-binding protein